MTTSLKEKGFNGLQRVRMDGKRGNTEATLVDRHLQGWVETRNIPSWLTDFKHGKVVVTRLIPRPRSIDGLGEHEAGDRAQKLLESARETLQDNTTVYVQITYRRDGEPMVGMVCQSDIEADDTVLRRDIGRLRNQRAGLSGAARETIGTQIEAKETAYLIKTGTPYARP